MILGRISIKSLLIIMIGGYKHIKTLMSLEAKDLLATMLLVRCDKAKLEDVFELLNIEQLLLEA